MAAGGPAGGGPARSAVAAATAAGGDPDQPPGERLPGLGPEYQMDDFSWRLHLGPDQEWPPPPVGPLAAPPDPPGLARDRGDASAARDRRHRPSPRRPRPTRRTPPTSHPSRPRRSPRTGACDRDAAHLPLRPARAPRPSGPGPAGQALLVGAGLLLAIVAISRSPDGGRSDAGDDLRRRRGGARARSRSAGGRSRSGRRSSRSSSLGASAAAPGSARPSRSSGTAPATGASTPQPAEPPAALRASGSSRRPTGTGRSARCASAAAGA